MKTTSRVRLKGGGGGEGEIGGGGVGNEGVFKSDAVNEEDPERDRAARGGGGRGGGGGFIDKQRMNVGR